MYTRFIALAILGLTTFLFVGCAGTNSETTTTTTDTRTAREKSSMYVR